MLQLNYSLPISQLFRYFTFLIASVGIVNSAPAEFFLESHTDAQFPARDSALGIEHNGSVWVMGGYTNFFGYPAQRLNDIWQSSDGFNWVNTQPVSSVWQPRNLPFGFSLGGSMWVMGGTDGHAMFDDIWSSEDGANWQLHNSASHFSARAGAFSTTFNNQMFVMGGANDLAGRASNDIWRSSNGNDWELVNANANWAPRSFGGLVTFHGKMWLLGGGVYDQNLANNNAGNYNDVWSSEDGVTWNLEVSSAPWSERRFFSSAVYDGKIWVIGGYNTQNLNDVWVSSNGTDWDKVEFSNTWTPRHASSLLAFDNSLFLLGGNGDVVVNSQVWTITAIPEPSSLFLLTGPCLVLVAVSIRRFRLGRTTAT